MQIELKILDKRLGKDWPLPQYETEGAGACDLRACLDEPYTLSGGATHIIPSGISISLPYGNLAALVLPRGGLGTKGLVIGNLVGLVDADYQGEIMLSAWNRTDYEQFTIHPGDRIAQLVVVPIFRAEFKVVTDFSTESERGEGRHGHTGVR